MDGGKENTYMGMCMIGQAKERDAIGEMKGEQKAECSREKSGARERRAPTVNYSGGQERRQIPAAALNASAWPHLLITPGLMCCGTPLNPLTQPTRSAPPPSAVSGVSNYSVSAPLLGLEPCLCKNGGWILTG